ncbi:MAG: alpha/beta hydrolase [Chloroflexi bacterium]|nr:alpha/beta hydrolase [Chloroflexota bacterium]
MKTHSVYSDGLTLVAEEFGAGPPFIFAHGLTANRAHSRRQLASLADQRRVVIYDQRGHAESSPANDPAYYQLDRMAGDMAAVMDHFGIEQAAVGGESMGAATSLRFALKWPNRVSALVLCLPALGDTLNPAHQTIKDIASAIAEKGMRTFAADNQQVMLANGNSPEHAAYWTSVLCSHQTESMALACRAVADWIVFDSIAELAMLHMPVFIIAIDDDPVHPLGLAQHLQAGIPHAILTVVKPSSDYLERPETVGELCRDFLDRIM